MFKVGDYVVYNDDILEVVVNKGDKLVLRDPPQGIFDEYKAEMLIIAKVEECEPLPF